MPFPGKSSVTMVSCNIESNANIVVEDGNAEVDGAVLGSILSM